MKKTLALILTAAMGVTALGACSNTTETSAPETQAETVAETTAEQTEATAAETTAEQTEATAAETTAAAFDPTITSDLQNLFDTGMEGLVGVNYTPVYYMGIPSDDPLGNTFLCMATAVVPDATPYWALVTMEDVGSEVTITEIKTICECGRKATVNARFDENGRIITEGDQVMLGGNDRYTAMCHRCWVNKIKEQQL